MVMHVPRSSIQLVNPCVDLILLPVDARHRINGAMIVAGHVRLCPLYPDPSDLFVEKSRGVGFSVLSRTFPGSSCSSNLLAHYECVRGQ